ncbi:MAG: hypothetical protein R6X13_01070 [bacterium]
MADFILFAGRFRLGDALAAVTELAGAEPAPSAPFGAPPTVTAAWGAAWCYGNRLEIARSSNHPAADPEFRKLGDIRTDMAMFYVAAQDRPGPREMLPFIRREADRQWAFCHAGNLQHPERIPTGGRIVDGRNPSERLFLHVLSGLDPEDPLPSVESALDLLPGEPDLNFLLLSADMLVASCRYTPPEAGPAASDDVPPAPDLIPPLPERPMPGLWFGTGESVRIISTRQVSTADVAWDAMANGSVFTISRKRWEL